MKKIFVILFAYLVTVVAYAQNYVSETKYDWSNLARSITQGKITKYDQAYAIYRWLCDNIAYDTTYAIHDADTAYEQRRGVCQAYSEIFYRLGEAIGLKVDIIFGKAKDSDGKIDDIGHAWVFVYTKDNTGILVDPTWGAGSVSDGKFTPTPGDDSWFHVDPHWMIFTHFPDKEAYQLIDTKIDYSTFASLPSLRPELAFFGYKGHEMLVKALSGTVTDIPKCNKPDFVTGINMPLDGTLHVGQTYDFAVRYNKASQFALINENVFHTDWAIEDDVAYAKFMPSEGGELVLAYHNNEDSWTHIVEYKVAQPTAAEIRNLEQAEPHRSPALAALPNYNYELYKEHGVDFARLLSEVKNRNITNLPHFYNEGKYHVGNMTMNGHLKPDSQLNFRFSPYAAGEWVIINGEDWLSEWSQDPQTREWVMDLTVAPSGSLILAFKAKDSASDSYSYCMRYEIGN